MCYQVESCVAGDKHGATDGGQLWLQRHWALEPAGPGRAEPRHDHAHDGQERHLRVAANEDRPSRAFLCVCCFSARLYTFRMVSFSYFQVVKFRRIWSASQQGWEAKQSELCTSFRQIRRGSGVNQPRNRSHQH